MASNPTLTAVTAREKLNEKSGEQKASPEDVSTQDTTILPIPVDRGETHAVLPAVSLDMDAVERIAYERHFARHQEVLAEAQIELEELEEWLGPELRTLLRPTFVTRDNAQWGMSERYCLLIRYKRRYFRVSIEALRPDASTIKPYMLVFPVSNFDVWVESLLLKTGAINTVDELSDYLVEMTRNFQLPEDD